MHKYLITWRRGIGPQWEHNFEMASDAMALDYFGRLVSSNSEMHSATSLNLWADVGTDSEHSLGWYELEIEVTAKLRK